MSRALPRALARAQPTGAGALGILVATAIVVRATRAYRPFPSVDDFAYLPLAWASHDPSLFPRDTLLRAFVHHTPAWDIIVAALDRTVGEALGFWVLTLLLTLATLAAVARILRATGASPLLLPIVAAVAFCGPVIGVGRGAYDGALGDAFHVQWLALCAVLWSYDAFIRGRTGISGAGLGLAALFHPVVAAHGAIALGVAAIVSGGREWRRLPVLAGTACLVSLPLTLPLLRSLGAPGGPAGAMSPDVVRLGYEFRAPQHYLPWLTPASTWWYLGVMVLAGMGGAMIQRPDPERRAVRRLAGLLAGQATLVIAGTLLYGSWLPVRWRYASPVPYLLDLSRTSGLLLPLAAVLIAGALELRPARRAAGAGGNELLWTGLLGAAAVALTFFVGWKVPLALLVVFALALRVVGPTPRFAWGLGLTLLFVIAVGLGRIRQETSLEAPVSRDEAQLYRWAVTTSPLALFIVPPGLQGFRFYARRSVYVDFKLFPPATPASAPEWRRRMELVSAPDRLALASAGWSGVPQWDRSYAIRNTPKRVVTVLHQTGADYLVWDRAGLDVPPYAPVVRSPAPGLTVAFANDRFEVYALTDVKR